MGVVSTPHGLRLAGQVELAAPDAAPDWQRAGILLNYARRMFPAHAARFDATAGDRWMGNRPSTPDGLPCIGPASGCADIVHAFG
ncbi:FAD-dependent oxidoreductase, partial [Acinetobacter baumannii]